jgi:hypothetical protein
METKKVTFMQACREFFGLKDGQSGLDFGREVKALTPLDRVEIKSGLEKFGFEIIEATAIK